MQFLEHLKSLIETFQWLQPSWDLFIFIIWIVLGFFYAMGAGKGKILSVFVSLVTSLVIVFQIPILSTTLGGVLKGNLNEFTKIILFSASFLILFILMTRYAFKAAFDGHQLSSIFFTFGFSILQIGLLIATVFQLLPEKIGASFTELVRLIFVNKYAFYSWFGGTIVYLLVLGKFLSSREEF